VGCAVYEKRIAAFGNDGRQEIVTIASTSDDTNPSIDPSIEGFEHFQLDVLERLRPSHSGQKNDVTRAELRRRQGPPTNTVAGTSSARDSEQPKSATEEEMRRFLQGAHRLLTFPPASMVLPG
jgi:hypothetical protein